MMRRFYAGAVFCGALTMLTAVGCHSADSSKPATDSNVAFVPVVLEVDEIEIIPEGPAKSVKLKQGKADKAEAPAGSGVTAKMEGDKVTVSAAKDAKEGTHEVKVKGDKNDATLKVTVKKKDK